MDEWGLLEIDGDGWREIEPPGIEFSLRKRSAFAGLFSAVRFVRFAAAGSGEAKSVSGFCTRSDSGWGKLRVARRLDGLTDRLFIAKGSRGIDPGYPGGGQVAGGESYGCQQDRGGDLGDGVGGGYFVEEGFGGGGEQDGGWYSDGEAKGEQLEGVLKNAADYVAGKRAEGEANSEF